jgi:hypothetical protein
MGPPIAAPIGASAPPQQQRSRCAAPRLGARSAPSAILTGLQRQGHVRLGQGGDRLGPDGHRAAAGDLRGVRAGRARSAPASGGEAPMLPRRAQPLRHSRRAGQPRSAWWSARIATRVSGESVAGERMSPSPRERRGAGAPLHGPAPLLRTCILRLEASSEWPAAIRGHNPCTTHHNSNFTPTAKLLASHEAMGSAPLVPFLSLVTWRLHSAVHSGTQRALIARFMSRANTCTHTNAHAHT